MDPVVNLQEQRELAESISERLEAVPDGQPVESDVAGELATDAGRATQNAPRGGEHM
jgi:hypothetical protein